MWPNPQFLIFCAVWNTRLCVNWTKTSFSKAYKLWTSLNKTNDDRKHLKKSKTKLLTKQTNYINASSQILFTFGKFVQQVYLPRCIF